MPRRKPKPVFDWRTLCDPAAPCRQQSQVCDWTGDCLRCFAWTGEECRWPRISNPTVTVSNTGDER